MINKEDNTFSKLESQPIQEEQKAKEAEISSDETVPVTTLEINPPPEPDEDLQKLYEKINQEKEDNESKKEPTK
jgi:hypothetical protein